MDYVSFAAGENGAMDMEGEGMMSRDRVLAGVLETMGTNLSRPEEEEYSLGC